MSENKDSTTNETTVTIPEGTDSTPKDNAAPEGEATVSGDTNSSPAEEAKVEGEEGKDVVPLTIQLPEGAEVDNAVLTQFTDLAANAGLTQEQAQQMADIGIGLLQSQANEMTKAWETTLADWQAEIDKDPHIGGDKTEGVKVLLGRMLDQYGSKEAREAFDLTGAGTNPHVVRFIHNMAKALDEGTSIEGGRPVGPIGKSRGERLYGSA